VNYLVGVGAIGKSPFSVRGRHFQLYDFFVRFSKPSKTASFEVSLSGMIFSGQG
jgi:hypothetical protein